MPKEYQFYGYDKLSLIKNIRELGGKKQGQYIFRVAVFNHPLKIQNTYIRIRDEGFRKTLTYKIKKPNTEFEEEHETMIENFDESVNILLGLGCTKKYSYEKIREIWHLSNTEIVFDTNPGEPEIMELESSSRKYLDNIVKKLDLSQFKIIEYNQTDELFGFSIKNLNISDITFDNVNKILGKLVTKNKKEFNSLLKYQRNLYDSLKIN